MYGGLDTITSNCFSVSFIALNTSDLTNSILLSTSLFIAFTLPTSSGISDISKDITFEFSIYLAKLTVIAPDPVPISSILISSLLFLQSSIISSTNVSVSGLGIKTPSLTKKSSPINSLLPTIYATGLPLILSFIYSINSSYCSVVSSLFKFKCM